MEVRTERTSELTLKINDLRVLNKVCTRCDIGQPVRLGIGNCEAKIMIVGDAPTSELIPFESRNGALIDKITKWFGTNRKQCYLTYLTKCNTKVAQHRKNCDWINKEIETIKPKLIITFGKNSVKHILKLRGNVDDMLWRPHNYTWGTLLALPPIATVLHHKIDDLKESCLNAKNMCGF